MKIGIAIIAIILLFGFIMTFGLINVRPTQVAVEINKVAGKVNPDPRLVGYKIFNRWITDMVLYNVATRSFPSDMSIRRDKGNELKLTFKTTDGQNVTCDLTIQYHLIAKEVPMLHQEVGTSYEREILMPKVRSTARIVLGGYSAEELYQGKVRSEVQSEITARLDTELQPYHMRIKAALIRAFDFSGKFEQKIEEKKLAAQQVEININLALAQEEEAKRQEAEARGLKLAMVQNAQGKAQSIKIASDAERYRLEQSAAGNLAIYKADAEGKRLAAVALGGGKYVVELEFARKLAPGLRTITIPMPEKGNYLLGIEGMVAMGAAVE